MIPLVVLAVLKLDTTGFAMVAIVLMLLAGWEWGALVPLSGLPARTAYLLSIAVVLMALWAIAQQEWLVDLVLTLALLWWLFTLFWITRPDWGSSPAVSHVIGKFMLGLGLFGSTWLAMVVLHGRPDQGPVWVLYLLVLVWIADSGAYFSGRLWGKAKLAPRVSPGKTWAGVYGALVATGLFAAGFALYNGFSGFDLAGFVVICVITVMFSIVGDLLESLLKRQQDVKDSGNLIPGHGGLLDRIDSLLAAAPLFAFGMRWLDL
jgi:phosphatidate cytidylyltransferase